MSSDVPALSEKQGDLIKTLRAELEADGIELRPTSRKQASAYIDFLFSLRPGAEDEKEFGELQGDTSRKQMELLRSLGLEESDIPDSKQAASDLISKLLAKKNGGESSSHQLVDDADLPAAGAEAAKTDDDLPF